MTTVTDAQALGQLHRADEIRDALVTRFPRMPQQQADSVSDFIMERETELRAEVSRLRAERDALREALVAVRDLARTGLMPSGMFATESEWLQHKVNDIALQSSAALAAVPAAPPQADDRLAWAEAGARKMQRECSALMWDDNDLKAIRTRDPAAIARRAVEGDDS